MKLWFSELVQLADASTCFSWLTRLDNKTQYFNYLWWHGPSFLLDLQSTGTPSVKGKQIHRKPQNYRDNWKHLYYGVDASCMIIILPLCTLSYTILSLLLQYIFYILFPSYSLKIVEKETAWWVDRNASFSRLQHELYFFKFQFHQFPFPIYSFLSKSSALSVLKTFWYWTWLPMLCSFFVNSSWCFSLASFCLLIFSFIVGHLTFSFLFVSSKIKINRNNYTFNQLSFPSIFSYFQLHFLIHFIHICHFQFPLKPQQQRSSRP